MKFKLQNTITELELVRPSDDKKIFTYGIDGYNPRTRFVDRTDRDGVVQTADLRVDHRTITFNYKINYTADSEFTSFVDSINAMFIPEYYPVYLIDTDNNQKTAVFLSSHTVSYNEGVEKRIGVGKIILKTDSPYYTSTATVTSGAVMNTEDTITLINDCNYIVFPVYTLINQSSDTNELFRLTNVSNPGSFIEVVNTSFAPYSEFIIDTVEGNLKLNDVLSNFSIDKGGLVYLLPGSNVIKLTCLHSPISLSVSWQTKKSL